MEIKAESYRDNLKDIITSFLTLKKFQDPEETSSRIREQIPGGFSETKKIN